MKLFWNKLKVFYIRSYKNESPTLDRSLRILSYLLGIDSILEGSSIKFFCSWWNKDPPLILGLIPKEDRFFNKATILFAFKDRFSKFKYTIFGLSMQKNKRGTRKKFRASTFLLGPSFPKFPLSLYSNSL